MIVFFNGEFVDESDVCISIKDGGFLMGHGVYETLRTFNGKARLVYPHLDRLFESAEAMGLHVPYIKDEIANFLDTLTSKRYEEIKIGRPELCLRIQLTSGTDSIRYGEVKKFTFVITAYELKPLASESVKVVTLDIERVRPKIKTTAMISSILSKKFAWENDAYESLMINRGGFVTEGTFTNVFLIKGGVLKTPNDDILYGITREEILKFSKNIMKVEECAIHKSELSEADEIFLSNSTMSVIPVTNVDDKTVGNGEVGSFTRQIKKLYNDSII